MANWNDYRPSAKGCVPCDCVDSLIKKGKQLQAQLEEVEVERNILAMLASGEPKFFNPLGIFKAKALRDRVLKVKEPK